MADADLYSGRSTWARGGQVVFCVLLLLLEEEDARRGAHRQHQTAKQVRTLARQHRHDATRHVEALGQANHPPDPGDQKLEEVQKASRYGIIHN